MGAAYERLIREIGTMRVIDTHEHLPPREDMVDTQCDVLQSWLLHYFSCDLISAGLSRADLAYARDGAQPISARFARLKPYWEACRLTGYGQALDITANALYGFRRVDEHTIESLNEAFRAEQKPGRLRKVLKDACGITVSLLDNDWNMPPPGVPDDTSLYIRVRRIDWFVCPDSLGALADRAEQLFHLPMNALADWEQMAMAELDGWFAKGSRILKCGLAYLRPLLFEKVDEARAARAFAELRQKEDWRGQAPGRLLQDYMMHKILARAERHGMTLQIHTGMQEGNFYMLEMSNPASLNNLFLAYPGLTFDVFHMGYPWEHVLLALVKMFPNVNLDLCWANIMSPQAVINLIIEYYETAPANKICAFGGDYLMVDPVYGHLTLARRNLAMALGALVERGILDDELALAHAKAALYDNPARIFGVAV